MKHASGLRAPASLHSAKGVRPLHWRTVESSKPGLRMAHRRAAGLRLLPESAQLPFPPQKPLAGKEKGSFADKTISQRLPGILRSIEADGQMLMKRYEGNEAALAQVRAALAGVTGIREAMQANAPLPHIAPPAGKAAQLCHPGLCEMIAAANNILDAWKAHSGETTWMGLPWLTIECYMYTAISTAIQSQPLLAGGSTGSSYSSHLTDMDEGSYDPFALQKQNAWAKSAPAVADLATAIEAIHADLQKGGPLRDAMATPSRLESVQLRLFEVVQYCLWGNKTDLSLRQDAAKDAAASLAETEKNMARGATSGPASTSPLIVNEFMGVWEHLKSDVQAKGGRGGRIDIILDNSGLELYGDLVLADFLIETGLASQVVFHGKTLPYFVSDANVTDFTQTITQCQLPHPPSPPGTHPPTIEQLPPWRAVTRLGRRWGEHLTAGRWRYADHSFWCTPAPFCWMEAMAPDLFQYLSGSSCIVTKGDLNYRKLTSDCSWPHHTPFRESLLGWLPAPLLSLRTCKADVVTGLAEGQAEALDKVDPEWRSNGKFGMIQFVKP